MNDITTLSIGDRVIAPVVREFEEGEVSDISYRFEPHPKDTPFEPFGPAIPTACVDVNGEKAWHDIETLRKVKNALPELVEQDERADLWGFLSAALDNWFSGNDAAKGMSGTVANDEKTYVHVYVQNGYTYEVAVRAIAWPGMDT